MTEDATVLAVIPARLESTRLSRKLLLNETGKPLLQHTWEAACSLQAVDRVLVATDSTEAAAAVREFGGDVVMTGPHASGTDRICEAIRGIEEDFDLVLNVQGDEPEVSDAAVDPVLRLLKENRKTGIATGVTRINSVEELQDPASVKAVLTHDGRALYFSRSVVPSVAYANVDPGLLAATPFYRHIGLYAYRRRVLEMWSTLPPSPLQEIESLEQLRPLQAGIEIRAAVIAAQPVGIDTLQDYERFVARHRDRVG